MAVHLRLQRQGKNNCPFYHVVATNSRSPRDGRFLEKVGHYNPTTEPSQITLDEARLRYWYERGAQMTNTVRQLVKVVGIKLERKPGATATPTPTADKPAPVAKVAKKAAAPKATKAPAKKK
jgi:small subunit ribosomal protein S16